jgi:SAM-dependent methyltransferase
MESEPLLERIRREWEERGRSPYRDFFVASHRGWRDPECWRIQAEIDVDLVLTPVAGDREQGIGRFAYDELDVLEIGCGVGRIATVLGPRVRSYVGVDLAESMVLRAREVVAHENCAFLVNDGQSFPPPLSSASSTSFSRSPFSSTARNRCALRS